MDELLQRIYEGIIVGNAAAVEEATQRALDHGHPPDAILSQRMILAMGDVGQRFARGEFCVPEMLVAARAMRQGLARLRPLLARNDVSSAGKVIIGTVKGDLHDIGKNLVGMMLEGAGANSDSLRDPVAESRNGFVGDPPHGARLTRVVTPTCWHDPHA